MGRVFTAPFEGNQIGANCLEGIVVDGGTPTIVTTSPRSGLYCLECYSTTTYTRHAINMPSASLARGFARAAIDVIGFEDQNSPPLNTMYCEHGGTRVYYGVDSSGHMRLYSEGTLRATGTYTLSTGTKYVLQFQVYRAGASSVCEGRLWDSTGTVLLETLTDTTSLTTANLLYFGLSGGAWNSANKGCRWDDFAVNDATGGNENSYPDPQGRLVFLKPIGHSAIGTWRNGANGNSGLWDAVDNTPPAGNTTETATTNIKVSASDVVAYDCDLTMNACTDVGIGANDKILLVQPIARYGNNGMTASILFNQTIVSNPAGSPSTQVTVPTTAHGTELSANWITQKGDIIYLPTMVNSVNPVMRVEGDFTTPGVGVLCVDFMGIMVEYKAAVPSGFYRRPNRPRSFAP